MAAAIGNQYAAKAKEFLDKLRKASVQEDWKRVTQAAEKLLDCAAAGEPWAIQILADRLDGKAHQSSTVEVKRDVKDMTTDDILAELAANRITGAEKGEGEPTEFH